MNIGLEDTLAYYTPEEFAAGFKKTMAFQPRVIKQNRGSSGEGIWIIKLKAENYCKTYGERQGWVLMEFLANGVQFVHWVL
jgi:glutathione synthase/RimK-type ligase-like ATP-grasp enzyme